MRDVFGGGKAHARAEKGTVSYTAVVPSILLQPNQKVIFKICLHYSPLFSINFLPLPPCCFCNTATCWGHTLLFLKLGFVLVLDFTTEVVQVQQQEPNLNFCSLELFQIYFHRGFRDLGQLSRFNCIHLLTRLSFKCGHTCKPVSKAFSRRWNGSSCPLRLTAGVSGVLGRNATLIPVLPASRCRLWQDPSCSVCSRDLEGHSKSCNPSLRFSCFPHVDPMSKPGTGGGAAAASARLIVQRCLLVLCFLFFGLCSSGGLRQQPLQSKATSLNPFPLREDKGQKQSCVLAPLSDRLSPPPVFRLSRSESSGSVPISPPSPTRGTERHQLWKAVAFSLDPFHVDRLWVVCGHLTLRPPITAGWSQCDPQVCSLGAAICEAELPIHLSLSHLEVADVLTFPSFFSHFIDVTREEQAARTEIKPLWELVLEVLMTPHFRIS